MTNSLKKEPTIEDWQDVARFHRSAVRRDVVNYRYVDERLAKAKYADEMAEKLRQKAVIRLRESVNDDKDLINNSSPQTSVEALAATSTNATEKELRHGH